MAVNENEITLKELLLSARAWVRYLRTKWLLIFLVGCLFGFFGFAYAYFQKTVYTGTLSFALEDEKGTGGGLGSALGLASQFGIDLGSSAGGAFSGSNLTELIKSRNLIERALLDPVTVNREQISLAEHYIRFNGWREKWSENPPQKNIQFPPNADRSKFTIEQDSILGIIYLNLSGENLSVALKDKKTSIIQIEVKTDNELFSKVFTEKLASEVSDFYVDTKTKKSVQNVAILQRQADSIRAALNNAITGVAIANDNTYNLNPAYNLQRTPSSRRQVDVQANTAILTQIVQNLELARVALRKETPLIQVIDRPILPLSKSKPGKVSSAMKGFLFGIIFFPILLLVRKIYVSMLN